MKKFKWWIFEVWLSEKYGYHLSIRIPLISKHEPEAYDITRHARFDADMELIVGFSRNVAERACGVSRLSWFKHMVWGWQIKPGTEKAVQYL